MKVVWWSCHIQNLTARHFFYPVFSPFSILLSLNVKGHGSSRKRIVLKSGEIEWSEVGPGGGHGGEGEQQEDEKWVLGCSIFIMSF